MIRFQRIGRKNDPAFRMLVLEKTSSPKAGTYVELVGTYNPKTKAFTANGEAIKGWIAKGAQVSPSLKNLLISKGVLDGAKTQVISKKNLEKNVAKKAAEEASAKEAAEKAAAAEAPAVAEEVILEEALAEAEVIEDTASVAEAPVEEIAPVA